MVRQNYARRVGACIACLVLTVNLVCTSYTRVKAAPPIAAAYAIEEVVAALLVSLGITGATGEALDKAGLTGTDATKILNSIYASAKEFSHDTDEIIDQTIMGAIADATETGKIIFKEGSKAWDAVKDWAKTAYNNIKTLTRDNTKTTEQGEVVYSSLIKNERVVKLDAYQSVQMCKSQSREARELVESLLGVSITDQQQNNVFFDPTGLGMYDNFIAFFAMASGTLGALWVRSPYYETEPVVLPFSRLLMQGRVASGTYWAEFSANNGSLVIQVHGDDGIGVEGARVLWTNFTVAGTSWLDGVTLPSVLNPSLDSAYDIVYNPTVDDFLDIATPTNTITREKDGTRTVAGDRTIDVARPIAYPIDLTKGIVIGKDIPIDDVLDRTKTDEKTDGKDDNKKDENKPPITPDLPSGAVGDNLEADLKSIFPFCIPFDLIACIKGLAADPDAPVWNIKIPMPTNYTWTITIDMSDYDSVVRIFRIGEDLLFIVGLIVITRNLVRG